jgi:hypothetical protein
MQSLAFVVGLETGSLGKVISMPTINVKIEESDESMVRLTYSNPLLGVPSYLNPRKAGIMYEYYTEK